MNRGVLSAQSVAADPPQLVLFFEADSGIGVSDGDPVAGWAHATPGVPDATQVDEAAQPVWKEAILNGLPVVRFDGVDDFMNVDPVTTLQNFSALLVARFDGMSHILGNAAGSDVAFAVYPGPPGAMITNTSSPAENCSSGDIGDVPARFRIYEVVRRNGVIGFKVNGDAVTGGTSTTGAPNVLGTGLIEVAFLGVDLTPVHVAGDIATVKAWAGTLPGEDLAAERAAIATKYGLVLAGVPVNAVLPAVTGTLTSGETLTTDDGTWAAHPNPDIFPYTYRWFRCDALGDNPVEISGETAGTYVLQFGDIGSTIRSGVTAHNSFDEVEAVSDATGVIA